MAPIEWSSKLELHPRFDTEHRKLTQQINKLEELGGRDPSPSQAARAIETFIADTREHAREEGALMYKVAYPKYIPQKIEQDRFIKDLENFAELLRTDQATLSADSTLFIRTWFYDHVLSVNKEFEEWLQGKNML